LGAEGSVAAARGSADRASAEATPAPRSMVSCA